MPSSLTLTYQDALRRTRNAVGDAVGAHWDALGHYDRGDVPRFTKAVIPVVKAGQARAVALSGAYLAKLTQQQLPALNAAAVSGAAVRNGVAPEDVYSAPFVNVWTSLQNEGDWANAVASGRARAIASALMDVALSTMASYVEFGKVTAGADDSSNVVAWRRVAEPGCCDFCQSIDGAHTGPDQPQPLHNRCGCTAEPIYGRSRPAADTFLTPGAIFGSTVIREHGELGLVVTQKGDAFTGPSDLSE
jgi:hypothetical protein